MSAEPCGDTIDGAETRSAVSLAGLTKSFGSLVAVNDVSLEIKQGEIVAFLGPNGAGKTTTLDMILGFQKPDSGTVTVLGRTPSEAIACGEVSAVMQTGGLLKDLTVRETVQLISTLFYRARPVDECLERAGIIEIANRRVEKCSGGEQQRLRFAIALLSDPELMLLDEPTTGMDVEGRRDFWNAIRQDAARGRTIMFATHYLEEADSYADRIILLRKGEIVADGTTAQIKNLASGRMVRATLPGAGEAELAAWPEVDSVEVRGDSVFLRTKSSDEVARRLLTSTAAHDLEITAHNLEDAFIALTSDESSPASPVGERA